MSSENQDEDHIEEPIVTENNKIEEPVVVEKLPEKAYVDLVIMDE